ncbi:unnamed protein product [Phytophthora fragariaefolia]|uniref:Unnamed protein product n=1 Tax=Phytophthora fragariaefolia TaxID=1490495 RepID=A0A9W6XU34_9STRA|nr:unnamed protein product [Phytophthora fragariaefolia]
MDLPLHVVDFVLWSRVDAKTPVNKLAVSWIGPYRVIDTRINSFDIEHLITGAKRNVHASGLKHYTDSSLEINEEILDYISNQDIYFTADNLTQHRQHPVRGYELVVGWEGLEDIEDSWDNNTIHGVCLAVKLNR